jgi:hypothetical protein
MLLILPGATFVPAGTPFVCTPAAIYDEMDRSGAQKVPVFGLLPVWRTPR